jgi:DNA-binding transcriptional regulator YhcF (GntR family)
MVPLHEQLKLSIRERVFCRGIPEGGRLPTVRELAEELGVNKNTVLRVYKELEAEGLLELRRGRGAYVRRLPAGGEAAGPTLKEALTRALRLARASGATEAEVRDMIEDCLGSVYRQDIRIAFVECHPHDAEAMASAMQKRLGLRVEPVVLDHFLAGPEEYFERFDLLVTTFFHYGEVKEAAKPGQARQIVGVDHSVSVDGLKSLSSIPKGSKVGLVCKNERTLDRLQKLVGIYCQEPVHAHLVSEEQKVRELFETCDFVITHTEIVQGLARPGGWHCQVITLEFQVTEQSIQYLHKRVADLASARQPSPGRAVHAEEGSAGGKAIHGVLPRRTTDVQGLPTRNG